MAEEAAINIVRISTVNPAVPTENHRMFLSALDLVWLRAKPVERLIFYHTPNEFGTIVERLKRSLSSVLVHFFPLAGRLAVGEQDRLEIECNDGGIPFVEASADLNLLNLQSTDFEHRNFFQRLVPTFCLDQKDDPPLIGIQVTVLEGEGICIGTSLNHIVADGNSYWHFMQSWAECCRGAPISRYPQHTRHIFKLPNNENESAQNEKDTETENKIKENKLSDAKVSKANKDRENPNKTPEDLVYKTFHFSAEMIKNIKARAAKNGREETFSSLMAVSAHFWRCVVKARQVPEEDPVLFVMLVDSRIRVNPPSPSYFGNCIQFAVSSTTARELLSQRISFAARLIKEAVNRCTEKNLRNLIRYMESKERDTEAEVVALRENCIVNVISSPRFPVYEIDYGWGRPWNVQAASINEIGAMVLFAGREGGGSMAISTCLPISQKEVFSCLLQLPADE